MKKSPLQTLLAASAILGCGDNEPTCRECGCSEDLVYDDDGDTICCDCLFEHESEEANQP
jgi:hypothetical protein